MVVKPEELEEYKRNCLKIISHKYYALSDVVVRKSENGSEIEIVIPALHEDDDSDTEVSLTINIGDDVETITKMVERIVKGIEKELNMTLPIRFEW